MHVIESREWRVVAAALVLGSTSASFFLACGRDLIGSQTGALHGATTATSGAFPGVVSLSTPLHGCTGTLVAPDTILTAAHCLDGWGQGCITNRDFTTQVKVSVAGTASSDASTVFYADGFQTFPSSYQGVDFSKCSPSDEHSCAACDPDSGLDASQCAENAYGVAAPYDVALIHIGPIFDGTGPHAPDFSLYPRIKVITDVNNDTGATPFTVHFALDSSAWSSDTVLTVVGWGANDYGLSVRLSGDMQTASWGGWLNFIAATNYPIQNCNQPVAADGGPVLGTAFETYSQRLSLDGGTFNGVSTDHGDSGGPLLVHGGTGTGQVPGLTEEVAIIGVLSGNTSLDGANCANSNGPIEAGNCVSRHAPTMANGVGPWLDQHLSDFDGDQIPDFADNCPTVSNKDQSNSNFDAELTLQKAQVDAGIDGHTPTSSDAWDYVEWWRYTFKGDACDGVPTTTAKAAVTFSDLNEDAGPCDVLHIYQMGGIKIDVDAGGTSCTRRLTSGLEMQSFVGNVWGDAKSSPGDSIPSWCTCSQSNALACSNSTFQCWVADDSTLPYTAYNTSPTSSQWQTMSQFAYPSAESIFSGLTNTHQDPSPLLTETLSLLQANWDFRTDFPSQTSLDGVVWAHVIPGTFTNNDLTYIISPFADSHNNHYQMSHVERLNGTETISVPVDILSLVPVWVKVERGIWDSGTFGLFGQDSASSDFHAVTMDSTTTEYVAASRFTSAAQSQLLNVASGDDDVLFGDDIVSGATAASGPRAAVLVASGTADVRGAISYSGTQIDGAASTTSGSMGTVSARAYSSALDRLFALRVSFTSGMWFDVHDLASSFATPGSDTVTSSRVTGLAVAISNPVAMTWNGGAGLLYVVDAGYDFGIGDTYYRLIAITQTGVGYELWRTGGQGGYIPTKIFLSSGVFGEVVLGVTYNSSAEFTVFDEAGNPRGSYTYTNQNLEAPVILNGAGATVGIASYTVLGPGPTIGPFTAVTTTRGDWSQSLCGTAWLRNIVDTSTVSPLSAPLLSCP